MDITVMVVKDIKRNSQQLKNMQNNKLKTILIILLLTNLITVNLSSAQIATEPQIPQKIKLNAILTPPYTLGPGDQLTVTDRSLKDLQGQQVERFDVTISPDGYISLPLPDGTQKNLLIAGYTIEELSAEVRELFGETLKNPLVFVQISRYRPINIYVGGEVVKPGIYKVETTSTQAEGGKTNTSTTNTFGLTITQAIQLASGLRPRADITTIIVTRGVNSEKRTIDLTEIILGKNPSLDIILQPGDTIFVSATNDEKNQAQSHIQLLGKLAYQDVPISIIGEAKEAGNFVLPNDATLLDAIGKAGGPSVVGSFKKIKLSRYSSDGTFKTQKLNIDELLKSGTKFSQIALRPNDVIELEASKGKEVRHFFRDTSNIILGSTLAGLSSFVVQDNMFNRLSRGKGGLSRNSLNSAGGGITIFSTPGQ